MAGKDRHRSSKPDLVIPPWEQSDPEASTGDSSAGSAEESPAGSAEGKAAAAPRKARYGMRRAGDRGERTPRIRRREHADKDTTKKTRRREHADKDTTKKTRRREHADKDTTKKTRRREHADKDTTKKTRHAPRGSAAVVVMVDGVKLTTVGFKAGKVVSVSEQDYDSEADALKAASARRGKKLIVWCGRVTARVARPADASEHPEVVRLADARYLANVFGTDRPAAMSGTVAMAPDAQDEAAEIIGSPSLKMAVSGMCVDLDEDGIWLRVGRSTAEATLVHDGRINGWTSLGPGLDSVAERIRTGATPAQARSEMADRLVGETRKAIMQWQRTRTVPPWIWLHGPGGDPSGEVHRSLLLHSGCRVAPPGGEEPDAIGLTQHMSLLPAAVHSLSAQLLQQPERTLQESNRIKKRRIAMVLALIVAVLGATASYSAYTGHRIRMRIDAANAQIAATAASVDHEGKETVARALEVKPALEMLHGSASPDWKMAFRLHERFPKESGLLNLDVARSSTAVLASRCCDGIAGYTDLIDELDGWAKAIYGSGGRADGHISGEEKPDGSIEMSVSMIRQE